MGRVCYHPCETSCNRGQLDEAVGINSVERFLGDEALKRGWKFAPPAAESGKRVLVVGAGPSGLSAAYHLRRLGHRVKIVEAGPFAGGMMRFGIPKYRLPRDVLDAEVQRILDIGVELELNRKVTDILDDDEGGRVRRGVPRGRRAHRQARLHSRGRGRAHARRGVGAAQHGGRGEADAGPSRRRVRRRQHRARRRAHGEAARARRESIIVYRRTREKMPAHDFEVEEALQEGVLIKWLSTIKNMADEGTLTVEKMAARRQGLPAADRRVRDARGRFAGAGARPGRRPVAARQACRA